MTAEDFIQITEPLSDAFLLISASGTIVAANRAAHDLFRAGCLHDAELTSLVGERPESVMSALQLWSSSRQLMPAVFPRLRHSGETVRCDGGVVQPRNGASEPLLLVRCTPRSEAAGTRLLSELGVEIETLRKHLIEQKAYDDEKIASLGSAAAVFAHEIANPLNAISTSLQIIEQELAEQNTATAVVREMLSSATEEIDRLTTLLSDFRSFARPRFADFRPANLLEAVSSVVMPLLPALRGRAIEVELDFQSLPTLRLDSDKIKQAILNLCNNAMEAMPQGGRLTIKGFTRPAQNLVVLEVTDTGIGITQDVDVFQLFVTSKPRGTGLGLPIVAQIVHAHGGCIDYRPAPEKGTTFEILLPIPRADLDNSEAN